MNNRGRARLIWLLVATFSLGLVSIAVGAALAYTDRGRAKVARWLADAINSGMAGTLEIGRISSVGFTKVRAHDVVFRAPDGKPAIEVTETTVSFDPLQLLRGPYGFSRAAIDGCLVHVTESGDGKVNMDETFASSDAPDEDKSSSPEKSGERPIDLRGMATSNCELVIGGGGLPSLRLVDLVGIMRVQVAPDGKVDLRFDNYRGRIVKGLPTGELAFEDVRGHVQTRQKKLLFFSGGGRSEGAKVAFSLDIVTEPKTRVVIDATFAELSRGAVRAKFVSAYTRFSPAIELNVDAPE